MTMRKGFLIYEEMRKYFPIYEEAVMSGASPGTTDSMDYRSMIVNIFGTEIM